MGRGRFDNFICMYDWSPSPNGSCFTIVICFTNCSLRNYPSHHHINIFHLLKLLGCAFSGIFQPQCMIHCCKEPVRTRGPIASESVTSPIQAVKTLPLGLKLMFRQGYTLRPYHLLCTLKFRFHSNSHPP